MAATVPLADDSTNELDLDKEGISELLMIGGEMGHFLSGVSVAAEAAGRLVDFGGGTTTWRRSFIF